jgi:hypothetical protein
MTIFAGAGGDDAEDFVQIKDLFPLRNLLQTSPLNTQLSHLMMPPQQQFQMMQQAMRQQ